MTFTQYLDRVIKETTPAIKNLLARPVWRKNTRLRASYAAFAQSIFGGKMLRAALVYLGYELAGGKNHRALIPVAAAFELMHSALIIHDDMMDNSLLRRGKPSLYAQLGSSRALCYGDLAMVLAIEGVSTARFSAARRQRALEFFLTEVSQTIGGQLLDVTLSSSESKSSLDHKRSTREVLLIHEWKTVGYSVVAPLAVGALLGGAKPSLIASIQKFGKIFGTAFQIQDDIMGVFGDEAVTGKLAYSDVTEGKNTLLIAEALKKATTDQRKILRRLYGKEVSLKELQIIREIFQQTGALAASEKMATEYLRKAKKLVPTLTSRPRLQKLLHEGIELIALRKK